MRFRLTERYIPTGSTKVADKSSDAVAYLYEGRDGTPYAIAYCGKRNKRDWHHRFRNVADRERKIREHFECRREMMSRTKPKAAPRSLYVGAILRTCWGYEQTNVEFYQVTALIGSTMVEVREIAQSRKATAWAQDDCYPVHDEFIGKPLRRKVSRFDGSSVRICDVVTASLWNGQIARSTSYA